MISTRRPLDEEGAVQRPDLADVQLCTGQKKDDKTPQLRDDRKENKSTRRVKALKREAEVRISSRSSEN